MFPLAFFAGALFFDVLTWLGDYPQLSGIGYYLCLAGISCGLLAAVPGLIDFVRVVPPNSSAKKRASMHGILNVAALSCFFAGLCLRKDEMTAAVLVLETAGIVILGFSGTLGSTLVHRNQIGIDHRYARAGMWKEARFRHPEFPLQVAEEKDLSQDQMMLLHIGKRRVVLAVDKDGYVAFDDRCTHRGGSLADGVMMCGRVHCPWHGSQYDVRSGGCVAGPATTGIQIYPVETRNGKVYLKALG